MNTVSLAATQASVNWRVANPIAAYEQFRLGWDYYTAREPYAACANSEQQRGYLAANASEAEASMGGYADMRGF